MPTMPTYLEGEELDRIKHQGRELGREMQMGLSYSQMFLTATNLIPTELTQEEALKRLMQAC